MSKGPGRIGRAILGLIGAEQAKRPDHLMISTDVLCRAAFGGEGSWAKAQRVSVLRAMYRIMAKETGWTTHRGGRGKDARVPRFHWQKPPEPKAKGKPAEGVGGDLGLC